MGWKIESNLFVVAVLCGCSVNLDGSTPFGEGLTRGSVETGEPESTGAGGDAEADADEADETGGAPGESTSSAPDSTTSGGHGSTSAQGESTDAETSQGDGSSSTSQDETTGSDIEPTRLANFESYDALDCPLPAGLLPSLHPCDGEEGHRSATRLHVPDAPFVVTDVAYDLVEQSGEYDCDATLAHTVEIFVVPEGAALPVDPSNSRAYRRVDVPASAPPAQGRVHKELALDSDFVIEAGEELVITLSFPGTLGGGSCASSYGTALCQFACEGGDVGQQYWSGAVSAPYAWFDLVGPSDAGFTLTPTAYGHPE